MFRENRCYLLSLHVVFTDVFNTTTTTTTTKNNNNSVTSIAPKSLQIRLSGASTENSCSISRSINKSSFHKNEI